MRLLVSVVDAAEARLAVAGGVDVVDVKNPAEGALGAPAPAVIAEVRDALPAALPVQLGQRLRCRPAGGGLIGLLLRRRGLRRRGLRRRDDRVRRAGIGPDPGSQRPLVGRDRILIREATGVRKLSRTVH